MCRVSDWSLGTASITDAGGVAAFPAVTLDMQCGLVGLRSKTSLNRYVGVPGPRPEKRKTQLTRFALAKRLPNRSRSCLRCLVTGSRVAAMKLRLSDGNVIALRAIVA